MLTASASQRVVCLNCRCNVTYVVVHFNKELLTKATANCIVCTFPCQRIGEPATGMTSMSLPWAGKPEDREDFMNATSEYAKKRIESSKPRKMDGNNSGRMKFRNESSSPTLRNGHQRIRTRVASGNDKRRLRKYEKPC